MAKVLGVELYNKDIISAVSDVINKCIQIPSEKYNRCISASGAHGLVYAEEHLEFKIILNSFYLNLPDGMPGVWIGRLKGENLMRRCYGPDFFKDVMLASADKNINHFLLGGKEGVALKLKEECEMKFNNKSIVGTYCPPFRNMTNTEMRNIGEMINSTRTNIVWLGLSTPKQEYFAYELKKYINVDFIITVGAAFDFHTGLVSQAPKWVQKAGFEWLYRLCKEPQRLYKRYLKIVPMFVFYNLKEFSHFCAVKFKKTK